MNWVEKEDVSEDDADGRFSVQYTKLGNGVKRTKYGVE